MTIIDVARELEADGTKRFTRPGWVHTWTLRIENDLLVDCRYDGSSSIPAIFCRKDLLATDWEEVKE